MVPSRASEDWFKGFQYRPLDIGRCEDLRLGGLAYATIVILLGLIVVGTIGGTACGTPGIVLVRPAPVPYLVPSRSFQVIDCNFGGRACWAWASSACEWCPLWVGCDLCVCLLLKKTLQPKGCAGFVLKLHIVCVTEPHMIMVNQLEKWAH